MALYKRIVVTLDLGEESYEILDQARTLCSEEGCITLLHVVQPIATPYLGAFPGGQTFGDAPSLISRFKETAEQQLQAMAEAAGIGNRQCAVLVGPPASEIRRYAKDNDSDLIVIGSHGQHGLGLLLGSTANGVLHGAPCDVLAVRVGQK